MKFLILPLLLTFVIGAHCRRPRNESVIKDDLKQFYKHLYLIRTELAVMLDSPSMDLLAKAEERLGNVLDFGGKVLEDGWWFAEKAFKEASKECEEEFPHFIANATSLIDKAVNNFTRYLSNLREDFMPTLDEYYETLEKQASILYYKLVYIFKRDEEKLNALQEEFISSVRPHVDQMNQELKEAMEKEENQPGNNEVYNQLKYTVAAVNYSDVGSMVNNLETMYKAN